jgi:hypothetical protein
MTYHTLNVDCGRLAAVAEKIALLTSANPGFRDDPEFESLKVAFQTALADVQSLAITL